MSQPVSLSQQRLELEKQYEAFKKEGLQLDMTRGKPSEAQLDLSNGLLTVLKDDENRSSAGVDTRNYGGLDGLPEMKAIFAGMLGTEPSQVVVGGNSSLTLMHDSVVRALLHGVPGGSGPWQSGAVKFLCPSPGYDRHFAICKHFGIEMIPVGIGDDGPDMDEVERLVAADAAIKGIWCVPKYSNPTGTTYSSAVVQRFAQMKTAAPDFRIFWDNAYAVHDLYDESDHLDDILAACKKAGNEDRPLVFVSTSKVSFAGAGVAAMAASPANIADLSSHLGIQTIGPDKVNQLRHVKFFGDLKGVEEHMKKHAQLLRPKFEAVDRIFEEKLRPYAVATWTRPRGGYFVSLDTPDGCAKECVKLAAEAGVKLTGAGATFPGGHDPQDRNIRIAPSLPPLEQVEKAMEVVAVCVLLAAARRAG